MQNNPTPEKSTHRAYDIFHRVPAPAAPSWESVLRAHGPLAFDVAYRLLANSADADDAVQDAFLDAFKLYARQPIANWPALLRSLATRRAIDRLRARRASSRYKTDPPAPAADQPDAGAIERELAESLRRAVADLPDREAAVFSLRYFADLNNHQIAEALDILPENVATALSKARAKLKQSLGLHSPAHQGAQP